MKKTYEEIVLEYMIEVFGKTVGNRLFLAREKKTDQKFQDLPESKKHKFLQDMLFDIYKEFYPKQKIIVITLELFFRYAGFAIADKVEGAIRKPVKMEDLKLEFGVLHSTADLDLIHGGKNTFMKLYLELSGLVDAGAVISFDSSTAQLITFFMMEAGGMQVEDVYHVEPDAAIIKEFYNIIVPGIIDLVSDNFNETVYFLFIEEDKFKAKHTKMGDDYVVEQVDSNLNMEVEGRNIKSRVTFLTKTDDPDMEILMARQRQRQKEQLYNTTPPKVIVDYDRGNKRETVIGFIDFMMTNQGQAIVRNLESKMNVQLNRELNEKDADGFISLFISHHLESAYEKKIQFAKRNLRVALGLEKK